MSVEILQRLHEEVFRDNRSAAIDELLSDDFVWRAHALPIEPQAGHEGIRQFAALLHRAFPDLSWQSEAAFSSGDRAVLRWSLRGTHAGELMGFAPTNHPIFVTGIHIARVENGRIAELWQNWGLMGLMQQLGLLPIIGEQTLYPERDYPLPNSSAPSCSRNCGETL